MTPTGKCAGKEGVALVKAMLVRGGYNDQGILAHFLRAFDYHRVGAILENITTSHDGQTTWG